MTARGNAENIALGPGLLFINSVGADEPDDLTTPWASVDPDWVALGYTATGSEFAYSLATDPVQVAEELDPLKIVTTGRTSSVKFSLAELTAKNLQRASNGGTITTIGGGIVTFEPPDLGTEVRCALGFQSEDGTERWVWRQAFQTGDISLSRAKGAANASLSCEFSLEKPASGQKIYIAVLAAQRAA